MVSKFAFPGVESDGMTFRQYAAVAAMQGLLSRVSYDCNVQDVATDSVVLADALIKEFER